MNESDWDWTDCAGSKLRLDPIDKNPMHVYFRLSQGQGAYPAQQRLNGPR